MCCASRIVSLWRDDRPSHRLSLAATSTFKDNRPPMNANPSPNLRRTAVLLHRGGAFVRGTEAILIRSAKALAAAGYRLVICRRNACIDGPLGSITPRPEFVDFEFPELMISGIRETSLPVDSYIGAFRKLRELVRRSNATLLYSSGGLPVPTGGPRGTSCKDSSAVSLPSSRAATRALPLAFAVRRQAHISKRVRDATFAVGSAKSGNGRVQRH